MMNKNLRNVVWFLIACSLCIFTMTIFVTVAGAPRIGWIAVISVLILQIAGLLYYLHASTERNKPLLLKIILILLHLSSFSVVICFSYSVFCLANEYHNPMSLTADTSEENIVIEDTDDLYIMYPVYSVIEYVGGNQPNRSDQSINLCCAAEFQKTYNLSYNPSQLPGPYVISGSKQGGYDLENTDAFSYYNGEYHFVNVKDVDQEIENAVKYKGCVIRQFLVIEENKIVAMPSSEYRCFRVLADFNNKLCVIDSKVPMHYEDFVKELQSMGVNYAMYLDMGSGWNYSWYRDNSNRTRTLIGMYWPFSHNWIVFKSE